jgi:hypothetical protein
MPDTDPTRALLTIQRVGEICDFIDHPAVKRAVEQAVPVTLPRAPDAMGFVTELWAGLGIVGLWAALDGYADRAELTRKRCRICNRRCISARFADQLEGNEGQILNELEDLRHLYAHNLAGEADETYFNHGQRHVLRPGEVVRLSSGAQFDGRRLSLGLHHLRMYSGMAQHLLERFL